MEVLRFFSTVAAFGSEFGYEEVALKMIVVFHRNLKFIVSHGFCVLKIKVKSNSVSNEKVGDFIGMGKREDLRSLATKTVLWCPVSLS